MKPNHSQAKLPPSLAEVVADLPADLRALVYALPQRLMDVAADAPVYVDRKAAADVVTRHVLPVSHRSLEVWPLPWRHANGKAITPLIAVLAVAYDKISNAAVVMGGTRRAAQHAAA